MQQQTLDQLINTKDPAWPLLQEQIATSINSVEVLPADRAKGEQTLLGLQVTTYSVLGAVALETGGIFIDHGWLRFLGSGHERMRENLLSWNGLGSFAPQPLLQGAFLVAHDVLGGFLALDGGAFGGTQGNVFYLAPDTLSWENLNMSYTRLLEWAITGDVTRFYRSMRWNGWRQEVASISGDQGISFYPPLWAERGPIAARSRNVIPLEELWRLHASGGR